MATLVLAAIGKTVGAAIGGTVGAAIGGALGTAVGSVADSWLVAQLGPVPRSEGPRLESLRVTSSAEGGAIPRVYGRMRIGGTVIWATDFREEKRKRRRTVSKTQRVTTVEYLYFASFAVAICEGPIAGIGRIWADGEPLDLRDIEWRLYRGTEEQAPDALIAAAMGAEATPAYRGTAYVVFEDLELSAFGNRLPQLSFEVFRPLAEPDTAEGALRAVTLIPGAGEIAYAAETVRGAPTGAVRGGERRDVAGANQGPALNEHAVPGTPDLLVALDRLQASAPGVESVSLVVSWFGDDLRAGECRIRPRVEASAKTTVPEWRVNGLDRAAAAVTSSVGGRPAYGGTPADHTVVSAIRELRARGLRTTFYPFIMMDVPEGNDLPDPYSDDAAAVGQPAYPWRGRITCSPAPGFAGSPDGTPAAAAQVAAFFGGAAASDFEIDGDDVSWTGDPEDWGLRRMILHYAHLCAAAGGVDAFLIGTEMRGLTWIRDGASSYPAVQAFRTLAADVRAILGPGTRISYAADWSEYFGHQPADGSGDVHFHLDPLWADPEIDFVGIDNYMPLSDWRDGFDHLDAQAGWPAVHDRAYLMANVAGGEGYDWFYASAADRAAQIRTPISDGAYGKPWVFRYKDLRAWWSNPHHDRPAGVEAEEPTAWVPESKPIVFTEFGCPAVDRGTNQPNVFYDPKSSESFLPYSSRGWRDDAIQRAYLEATALFWNDAANNPVSSVYDGPMVAWGDCAAWTWDARPWPWFPALGDVWADGPNWTLGHWLTGRLGAVSLAALVRDLCRRAGLADALIDVSGLWGQVEGFVVAGLEAPRETIGRLARLFGFDAVESGGVLRFTMRGRGPAAMLALLGEPEDGVLEPVAAGDREPFERVRAQESELPASLTWTVARADDDRYDGVAVAARRLVAEHAREASEAFPAVLPPEAAERLCAAALAEDWTARETLAVALPPSALRLDPGDVLEVADGPRRLQYRITTAADTDARRIEAVRQEREDRDAPMPGARPARLARPPALTAPEVTVLDVPWLWEDRSAHQPLLAAGASPWPGTLAVWRADGAGWEAFATTGFRARAGRLVEPLAAGERSGLLDERHTTVVELDHGELASAPWLDVLAGSNLVAIGTDGDWELLQFRDATLVAPRRWRIGGLLRGQRGTERAMRLGHEADATVVVLDDDLDSLPFALGDVGLVQRLRIGPAALPVFEPLFTEGDVTPRAVGLIPFAPVHARLARLAGGDLRLSWTRRDRAPAADSWELAEVPLSESQERYLVEVLDGETVVRRVETSAPHWIYGAAEQTADWGAPVEEIEVRIAQQGLFRWGYPLRATVRVGMVEG